MRTSSLNLVVMLALSIPLVWCFGPLLTGERVFAYRDAAHFYYPLEAWVCQQWSAGHPPLWNAQDGNGMPVVADATSTVCYPGKLLFALPLEFSARYVWYTILHVLVAAMGAYNLARCRCHVPSAGTCDPAADGNLSRRASIPPNPPPLSRPAAGLCAVAYTFSGAVLFQYCNVVFLVGAAWLPWALLATHRMLTERSVRWALVVGMCLALMVLGGDPQSAYHTGLLAALYATIVRRAARSNLVRPGGQESRRVAFGAGTFGLLAIAAITGVLLAAVQVVPAWSWIATSDRAVFTHPRSVYEVPAYLRRHDPVAPAAGAAGAAPSPRGWTGVAQGLWGTPLESEHHRQAYRFSVAPWRLVEMLWPNVSGRTFPENHRWLAAVGGEDAIWTPSLYLGVLPLVLGIGTWRLRRAEVRVRWFSWIFLLAVLGSFGWYGLGLLLQSVQRVFTHEPFPFAVAEPVGGVYWLMTLLLPGYVEFRYPAKLLVVASLALAALAGIGLDRMLTTHREQLARWLRNVGAASLLAVILVAASKSGWGVWLAQAHPDELYGPLDPHAAWLDALTACVHTALVCGAGWWLVCRRRLTAVRLEILFLLLTACEIAWANGWMVLTAPLSAMQTRTVMSEVHDSPASSTIYRWPARTWVSPEWRVTSSPARAEESVRWDTATLYAKLHLLGPHRSLVPQSTITASDFRAFVSAGSDALPHPAVLDVLGVEYLIVPEECAAPGPAWLETVPAHRVPGVRVWKNLRAFPRAWIVHDVEAWPPWKSSDPQSIREYYRSLLFPQGRPRDFRSTAVVERELPELTRPADSRATETARVTAEGANRVKLSVSMAAPGLVVLNQFYDPRWVVDVTSDSGTQCGTRPVRTNRIMQGVFLPAGTHNLVFRYAPRDLYWAGAVSVTSWLVVLVSVGVPVSKRVRWVMTKPEMPKHEGMTNSE